MAVLETIRTAVAKYGMTVRMTGDLVSVYDKKGRLAGTVTMDGAIDRKYVGTQTLMGALVRDTIAAALKGAK